MEDFLTKLSFIFRPAPKLHVAYDKGGRKKPTIVLLHGVAATSGTWKNLIPNIDSGKYRVIAIDLLGFGKSPKPLSDNYDVNTHIRSVRKTLKKLRVRRRYILIGHSMGAIIAARYCRYYPREFKRLILIGLPFYLKEPHLHNVISKTHTDFYLNAYKFMSENPDFTINNAQLIRKALSIDEGIDVKKENWHSFRLSLINTIINQNSYDDIKHLNIPVDVVYGVLDQFLVQEVIKHIDVLGNVKVTRVQAADHTVGKRISRTVADLIKG